MTAATASTLPDYTRADDAMAAGGDIAEFVTFSIGDDQYGIDIMSVREIKEWPDVTRLPKQPEYVRGLLNLRGVMVPIIDLRCYFGNGATECGATHIVIIVQMGERLTGLLADRVLDIVTYERSKIQRVPQTARESTTDFLAGLIPNERAMIALIDLRGLLLEEGMGLQ